MTTRDELIEKAAKALLDSEGIEPAEDGTYWGAGTWPNAVKDARTCWAVFEQAHPVQGLKNPVQNSDDERVRLDRIVGLINSADDGYEPPTLREIYLVAMGRS